eukprot:2100487-Rhodomonas_salina.1
MAEDEAGVAEAEALVDAFLAQHQLASNQVTAPGPPLAAPLEGSCDAQAVADIAMEGGGAGGAGQGAGGDQGEQRGALGGFEAGPRTQVPQAQ